MLNESSMSSRLPPSARKHRNALDKRSGVARKSEDRTVYFVKCGSSASPTVSRRPPAVNANLFMVGSEVREREMFVVSSSDLEPTVRFDLAKVH